MTVKDFLAVIPFSLVDYAKIYENKWDEDWEDDKTTNTGKRVHSQKDLEPYLEYKLSYFDYETQWGEYFDSAIYINMPKEK